MRRSLAPVLAACTLLSAGTTFAEDTPCEERIATACGLSKLFPFNTIGTLTWPNNNGNTSVGTAFLVGPHCALTNGHCVYNRNAGEYIAAEQTFTPGACRSDWGGIESQFGSRTVHRQRANNKWADTSYSPKRGVDYGAIQIVCPFSELTTFMPLCFGYEFDWCNMAGYPVNSLPDSSKIWNQWLAYGDVTETHDRWLRYDAHSTGGASGSPVMNWSSNDTLVEVFAINSTHWNDCDGGGPRLVWQNENLIRSWMQWEPTAAERWAEGCPNFTIRQFPELFQFFLANDELRFKQEEIRVENPVAPPPSGPSRRMMQVIEGGFYEWLEYDLQPGEQHSNRLILLLEAPGVELPGEMWLPGMEFNPQTQGWLSVPKAIALLSGSAGRASAEVQGLEHVMIDNLGELEQMIQPTPDDFNGQFDPASDEEGPTDGPDNCPADLNGDGTIDGADLSIVLGAWGDCTNAGADCAGDLNGDGTIDGADLSIVLGAWGNCA